jgi:hypothetical protein
MAVACEFSKCPNDEDLVNLEDLVNHIGTKLNLGSFLAQVAPCSDGLVARLVLWLGLFCGS